MRHAQHIPPAHRGGAPTAEIRETLRLSTVDRIPVLEALADDKDTPPSVRVKAIDLLLKYGIGTPKELDADTIRDRLASTVEILREELPKDLAEPVLSRLRQVWSS